MIRAHVKLSSSALAFALAVFSTTSVADAGSPGGSGGVSPTGGSGSSTLRALATPANVALTATGDGLSLTTNASALLSHQVTFHGWAPLSTAGDTVVIERRSTTSGAPWTPTAQATVTSTGSYAATWLASQTGRLSLRAVLAGDASATPPGIASLARAADSGATPVAPASGVHATLTSLTITVFRVQVASWYGPGLFGRRTACGQRLRAQTLGVASPTLRCGTLVELDYRGRAIVVPVIDRGPYAAGVQWDLTQATAIALGMPDRDPIGVVAVPAS